MGIFSKKNNNDDQQAEAKDAKAKDVKIEKKEEKKQTTGGDKAKKTTKAKATSTSKTEKATKKTGNAYKILVKPLVTEKAANLGTQNKYVFEVSTDANKIEIAKAVEEVYGVMPVSVNVIKMKGKRVRYGRTQGKRKDWKKAMVTLPEGKTINIYEGI